jgi:hypothetical protein
VNVVCGVNVAVDVKSISASYISTNYCKQLSQPTILNNTQHPMCVCCNNQVLAQV